jgi:hypothetical protein
MERYINICTAQQTRLYWVVLIYPWRIFIHIWRILHVLLHGFTHSQTSAIILLRLLFTQYLVRDKSIFYFIC